MQLNLYQIDAFTSTVFSGSPAAVVPLEAWLPAEVMQSIAIENSLPETAFYVLNQSGQYEIRWFSPFTEIDFCGHATLQALLCCSISPVPASPSRSGPRQLEKFRSPSYLAAR